MSKQYLKYIIAFNQISAIGPIRFKKILNYFQNLESAWQADEESLSRSGLEPKIVKELINRRRQINPDRAMEDLEKLKIKTITIFDKDYPDLLKEIYAPPPLLYYYGNLNLNDDFPLAVVGSRKMSLYGEEVTKQLVKQLIAAGLSIVSGLALGVDACAQKTALEAKGKTIGVLGSGLDKIYPSANRNLAEKIITSEGALISEFPLGMPALRHNFPQRNRIIAGLSLGTLITEAGQKSGALITAGYALEQNREIFAVPGNIYQQNAAGPNNLIKMGAKMVTCVDDILETLNLEKAKTYKQTKQIIPGNKTEKILIELLSLEPVHVDKLVKSARLDISVINSALAVMEMKGLIKHLGSQKYIKAR